MLQQKGMTATWVAVTFLLHVLCRMPLVAVVVVEAADLTYTIPEEQPPGTRVGNLARDTDLEQYVSADSLNNLRFSFLAGEPAHTALFRLDGATGDLSTARSGSAAGRVDREAVCPYSRDCVLPLQVAIQSTLNQFFKKVSVDINVTDINDNTPTFAAKSAEVIVSETVSIPSTFPLMSALDLDMGPGNGLRGYELVPAGGPFGLSFTAGSPNLRLVVERDELDHERQESYQVQVIARDGGSPPRTGTLLVNITIEDENDNEPVFTERSYSVTVDEDVAKGHVLIQVTATDRDSGDNGRVRYRLSPQQARSVLTMFAMDDVTGELTVAGDIENGEKESYDIIVQATDMGSPQPFTTTTTITVTVRDTINSPPRLTVSLLAGGNGYSTISEYASLGAVVAHIAVKDGDRGRNGIVQCDIERHPYFELQGFDVNEYKVIVARALDRETVAAHNVTVYCTDAGVTALTASSTFEVRVADENDNSPRFLRDHYRVYLAENTLQGKSIVTVIATDPDAGDNGKVRYSLHPNARGRFIISSETGVILTHDDFDYELETSFNFTVVATDQGKPQRSDTVDVTISITDVNDQKPSFARDVFPFTVSEFAMKGKVVGRVTANDFERGMNGQVDVMADQYSFGIPFTVLPNGSIILTGPLDHEDATYYYFRVMAVDRGRPPLNDTAEVQITVLDENDNRPVVLYPNGTELHLYVSMDDDIAKPLAMIKAQDPDSGLNGQIQFIITSRNDSGRFDVDPNSGEVFITRSLNRNDVGLCRLQVLVQDSGTPPLPADRTITVWIHAGNGTGGVAGTQAGDQYILITLAIVCITIILSAIIVLIIVVMRRMDRRQKPPVSAHGTSSRVLATYTDRVKADNLHNECVDGGVGDKEYGGGGGGGFGTFGKGVCEEDEEFGFSTFGGVGGGGKQEGMYGGHGVSLAQDQHQSPIHHQSYPPELSASPPLPEQMPVRESEEDMEMEAMQLHHMFLQSYHDTTPPAVSAADTWPSPPALVRQEDGQSDSSGETIPSDSGRGGSEEDISHSGGHAGGAALNDDSRLAALHDASFQSLASNTFSSNPHLHPNPSKSSVRDPIRNSSRKHVTFKDLAAGKRGPRPLAASLLAQGITGGSGSSSAAPSSSSSSGGCELGGGLDSPRDGSVSGQSPRSITGSLAGTPQADSPRYSQLPNTKDSPRNATLHSLGAAGSRESLNSLKGSQLLQQDPRDSPRNAVPAKGSHLDSARAAAAAAGQKLQEAPVSMYVNEPFGTFQNKPSSSTFLTPKDKSRYPNLFHRENPNAEHSGLADDPRGSFKNGQELQTFYPAPRPLTARQSGSRDNLAHRTQREAPPAPRDVRQGRDWRDETMAATTDDYDDQRSTTTSGSYTIDNEDGYVGLDLNRSPWKDVVV
ncbi:protocadherin-1-like [Babylonia areolata]|uniref:protocadherin-1-like n=1 Tax=Babylonia areolata TaxID=304850 RepID=UPI003FCFF3DD